MPLAKQIQLTVIDGKLALDGELILVVYPAGDCDYISWPLTKPTNLARALYDAHQCMGFFSDGDTVLLPDGSQFGEIKGVHFIADRRYW